MKIIFSIVLLSGVMISVTALQAVPHVILFTAVYCKISTYCQKLTYVLAHNAGLLVPLLNTVQHFQPKQREQ